jgi:putative hydrolase
MSGPGSGGGDFLERMLNDLIGLMGSSGGSGRRNQVELARTFAHSIATSGEVEPNVDPMVRMQLEDLLRVAEMHVLELTGLPVTQAGSALELVTVGPGLWAWHTLEDWSFVLDAMSGSAQSQQQAHAGEREEAAEGTDAGKVEGGSTPLRAGGTSDENEIEKGLGLADLSDYIESSPESPSGPAELVGRFMRTMGPMLAAMQLGSAVGHLARTTLGQYELPVPRPGSRLLLVPANIERFAADWSLPVDEVRLWICLRELTASAVLTRPHVASRMRELITDVVRGMSDDVGGAITRLGDLDLADAEGLQRLLGDPEALLATRQSPRRRRASEQLEAVTAALLGYIDHVLDRAALRLLGGRSALEEAWRRRLHDRGSSDRAAEMLLGLDLGPAQIERGSEFVRGVIGRAGEGGLAPLWSRASTLPTPAEVDAPGLWLERIRLSDADQPDAGSDG